MIEQAVSQVEPLVGTLPACRVLGASRASLYRWRSEPTVRVARARAVSPRALSEPERGAVLARLHEERFADCSPAHVYATLLDEGTYLASERTMYRLLAARGEVRERRDQLTHPPYAGRSYSPAPRTRFGRGTSRSCSARRRGRTSTCS
jgi:putative transposase